MFAGIGILAVGQWLFHTNPVVSDNSPNSHSEAVKKAEDTSPVVRAVPVVPKIQPTTQPFNPFQDMQTAILQCGEVLAEQSSILDPALTSENKETILASLPMRLRLVELAQKAQRVCNDSRQKLFQTESRLIPILPETTMKDHFRVVLTKTQGWCDLMIQAFQMEEQAEQVLDVNKLQQAAVLIDQVNETARDLTPEVKIAMQELSNMLNGPDNGSSLPAAGSNRETASIN